MFVSLDSQPVRLLSYLFRLRDTASFASHFALTITVTLALFITARNSPLIFCIAQHHPHPPHAPSSAPPTAIRFYLLAHPGSSPSLGILGFVSPTHPSETLPGSLACTATCTILTYTPRSLEGTCTVQHHHPILRTTLDLAPLYHRCIPILHLASPS